jgi:CTP synthase (UTP-ammonia lyase)
LRSSPASPLPLREKKIPFFGICLGMQCATIEFARNTLDLSVVPGHRRQ